MCRLKCVSVRYGRRFAASDKWGSEVGTTVRSAEDGGPYRGKVRLTVATGLGSVFLKVGATVPGRPRVQIEMRIGPVRAPLRGERQMGD